MLVCSNATFYTALRTLHALLSKSPVLRSSIPGDLYRTLAPVGVRGPSRAPVSLADSVQATGRKARNTVYEQCAPTKSCELKIYYDSQHRSANWKFSAPGKRRDRVTLGVCGLKWKTSSALLSTCLVTLTDLGCPVYY